MSGGEFAAIEARANAATVGPWEVATSRDVYSAVIAPTGGAIVGMDFESDANAEFIAHAREDIPALLAAVRERDNTIARVREVGLLGLDQIAQKSIDATVAKMHDQLGCTPDDLGPDVMAKIVDSHIEQAELFAGPVLDALRAALDPQETP